MKILNLVQGSAEWQAHRARHFNASDAPAMLGCSPYKTRSQLLREMHSGLTADVDAATQHRFDNGHRFEALARPLAENILSEDLYAVTGSRDRYSASFDGLTLGGDIAWEHKTLSIGLREAIRSGDLPKAYRAQMEHQLLVSGAEKVLFMASSWEHDVLVEEAHCWYAPDAELRAEILQGWEQFERDLAAYVPTETPSPVVAAPVESLPAVSVRMDGALAVVSNLDRFGLALRGFVERIPKAPENDQQFADCEAACKTLKTAEEALDAAESGALASISSVEEMRRVVADLRLIARTTRLTAEKMVERRKIEIKTQIIEKAKQAFAAHVARLRAETEGLLVVPSPDFAAAVKSKRTLASLQDAVDTALARGKIEADAAALELRARLAVLKDESGDFGFLFADRQALVAKPVDDLRLTIRARIEAHEKAEAERARKAEEAQTMAAQAVAKAAAPAPAPAAAPTAVMNYGGSPDEPLINLGEISDRLGFVLSASFIADKLGIVPHKIGKAARLYRASDFRRICAALVRHVTDLGVRA